MAGRRPGPRKLPADVIELTGNRSKLTQAQLEERRESEVRPRPLRLEKPDDLTPDEEWAWDHHVPELERLGLSTVLDAGSFRALVHSFGLMVASRREMLKLDDEGRPVGYVPVVSDSHGPKKNPAAAVWHQAATAYRAWCGDFGLTPLSRVGLRPAASSAPAPDAGDDDAAFFGT